jgi:hypothetical protein
MVGWELSSRSVKPTAPPVSDGRWLSIKQRDAKKQLEDLLEDRVEYHVLLRDEIYISEFILVA